MSDSNASDPNAAPDYGSPDQVHPDNTRPIVIGFHGITAATTQIGYTIEACDNLPLGSLTVSLMSGSKTATSTPDPAKKTDTPTITVSAGWVQNPLSYTVTDAANNVLASGSMPIPYAKVTPVCPDRKEGGHHHHHHKEHEHHEEPKS